MESLPNPQRLDRKSTRLNSSHLGISYAVFCLKKKKLTHEQEHRAPRHDSASPRDSLATANNNAAGSPGGRLAVVANQREICECFFFFLMIRRPPKSPLFPSTTLSR